MDQSLKEDLFPPRKIPRFTGNIDPKQNSTINDGKDPNFTANRGLTPIPGHREYMRTLKSDHILFMDVTNGTPEHPEKTYGMLYNQVESLGPIHTIRMDQIFDFENVPVDLMQAARTTYTKRLNKAGEMHLKETEPGKNYDILDVVNDSVHRFFCAYLEIWQELTKNKYRMGGLIKWSPVNTMSTLGDQLYFNPTADGAHFLTSMTGKHDIKNIWKTEAKKNLEPPLFCFLGFNIQFIFKEGKIDHTIDVIPRIVPVMTEKKEKRMEIFDYNVGVVAFNARTNKDLHAYSAPVDTVQVNLDAS